MIKPSLSSLSAIVGHDIWFGIAVSNDFTSLEIFLFLLTRWLSGWSLRTYIVFLSLIYLKKNFIKNKNQSCRRRPLLSGPIFIFRDRDSKSHSAVSYAPLISGHSGHWFYIMADAYLRPVL